MNRRQFLKLGVTTAAVAALPWSRHVPAASATARFLALAPGLSDPAAQPKFTERAPNALDPSFIFRPDPATGEYTVGIGVTAQQTGLVDGDGTKLWTMLFGYGQNDLYTWPGKTFEIVRDGGTTIVNWENRLFGVTEHLVPLDTSIHWCYSLPGYEQYTIANAGVPIVPHLHGGHTDFVFDGNPEFFWNPGASVVGPQWGSAFTNKFVYDNDVRAGTLWYHDHALGITRLNVYAGLAGFYIVRDTLDTGKPNNSLGLPAFPYELAYAIQDRMFYSDGRLFYPAFPGDPFYADFIDGEGAILPPDIFPGGGPTALAEFFGDHIVVNGKIWPKTDVEPRHYRLRLLNGSDSRFFVLQFRVAASPSSTDLTGASAPLPFWVIGSDQGLAASAVQTDTLVFEPGGRYDVVFDFSQAPAGSRVIMTNIGPDAPFGGSYGVNLDPADLFPDRQTDRVMAFDVTLPLNTGVADLFDPAAITGLYAGNTNPATRVRKVALFEGRDEFGRLQPLLGVAEPATDYQGNPILHVMGPLAGQQINGAVAWHEPTTENPALGSTEIWEIYNATEDAHPIHLHQVHFEILNREGFSATLVPQEVIQHNGTLGVGFRLENIALDGNVIPVLPVERAPKDMVTALPGQVTRIKATFDKPGRYVWHCHILSHEDHEMMRVLHVGAPLAPVITVEFRYWRSDRIRGHEKLVLFSDGSFLDTDGERGQWYTLAGGRKLVIAYPQNVKHGMVLVGLISPNLRIRGVFVTTDGSDLWGVFGGTVSALPPTSRAATVIDPKTQKGIDAAESVDVCSANNAAFRDWIGQDPTADPETIQQCQSIFLPGVWR